MHAHHRTVDRITTILEIAARSDGVSLSQLARQVGAPKSSVQGLVYGLAATGYLVEDDDHRYYLGPGPFALTLNSDDAGTSISKDALTKLTELTGANALVAVQCGENAIYVAHSDRSELFTYYAEQRIRRPLLTTAVGKVMLAQMSDEELRQFLRSRPASDRAAVDAYLLEVADIRRLGYAVSRGGSIPNIDAVATALPRARGQANQAALLAWKSGSIESTHDEMASVLVDQVADWSSAR